jgi:hypothetical protein
VGEGGRETFVNGPVNSLFNDREIFGTHNFNLLGLFFDICAGDRGVWNGGVMAGC